MKILSKWLFLTVFLGILGSIAWAHFRILPYGINVYEVIGNVPEKPAAVVFGGGMEKNGSQTVMQADRVLAGIELYQQGKVSKLVVTGDDGSNRANEVDAMKQMMLNAGVPEEDIIQDGAGFRTYSSCYRAKAIYGLEDIIAVSQDFHLSRIIYLCTAMGIDTLGFSADRHKYHQDLTNARAREVLARVKAWWQAEVTKPLPRVLGEPMPIFPEQIPAQ